MKVSDLKSEKEIAASNSSKAAPKVAEFNPAPVIITILPFLSMLVAILPSVIYHTTGINTVKAGIITLLLTSAVSFYIRVNADGILDKKLAKTVITLSYLASICLLLFVPESGIFCFWMIGGLLVCILIDHKLGLLFHFNLSFLMGIMVTNSPELVLQVLIMGIIISMLSNALVKKSTVLYAFIIILSTNITLSFVLNNMIFETESNYNYFLSLISVFLVLVTVYFVSKLYHYACNRIAAKSLLINSPEDNIQSIVAATDMSEAISKDREEITFTTDQKEDDFVIALQENIVTNNSSPDNWTSYEVLCDLNNQLLMSIKEYSESLYEHAVYIGDLSYRAAKEVNANEFLAKAGGLYHDVGKIKSKNNYIEEGLMIADEYSFPKDLKAILKEHNIKSEKPGSVEAAIVMLSDSVVSTIEYIVKNKDHRYTTNKIIDNIFQLRMEKGSFDASSLSLKDYKLLKEFYQKEFDNKGQVS